MSALTLTPTRRSLMAMALGAFAIGTGEFVMLGVLPNVAGDLHVSIPRAGWLISMYALGVVVGAPVLTAATVRLPRKGLLISLAIAMAVGNVVTAMVPGFWAVFALRFLTGLPHGAYFGVAAVVASSLVAEGRKGQAMAMVFLGLTFANIVGVPLTTLLGQQVGWRWVFVGVGAIHLATAAWIALAVERMPAPADAATVLSREVAVFRGPAVWMALLVATVAGAAMFSTFSYITPMMTHLAGYAEGSVMWLMMLFGIGMTVGSLIGARGADRALMPTLYIACIATVVIALVFTVTAHNKFTAALTILIFPMATSAIFPAVQTRIVSLAAGAPNLAAASIHSAFNVANSIGAWAGGMALSAGWGYGSPNVVAAGVAVLGLGTAVLSARFTTAPAAVTARAYGNREPSLPV